MITLPRAVNLETFLSEVSNSSCDGVIVWSTPSVANRLRIAAPWQVVESEPRLLPTTKWLVVAGGGTIIDRGKALRSQHPHVKLAALPTIWGSGAEASPIAVLNERGAKTIHVDTRLLPDLIIDIPDLADTLSNDLVRDACGDSWSHAVEGFLSPVGSDETRSDLAAVIVRMLALPLQTGRGPEWFEVSRLACAGQARASVGLVHGFAHALEPIVGLSHARLCRLFLLPVLKFDQAYSPKWSLFARYGLDPDAIVTVARSLFDPSGYTRLLPAVGEHWSRILRDACTRTNSALVRPDSLVFFQTFALA
jgi:hypothetical protein